MRSSAPRRPAHARLRLSAQVIVWQCVPPPTSVSARMRRQWFAPTFPPKCGEDICQPKYGGNEAHTEGQVGWAGSETLRYCPVFYHCCFYNRFCLGASGLMGSNATTITGHAVTCYNHKEPSYSARGPLMQNLGHKGQSFTCVSWHVQ